MVDLGGGTFDLSVLKADQRNKSYEAIDVDGDKKLGGDDFDNLIYEYFIGIIQDDLGLDLSTQEKSGLDYAEYYSMTGQVRNAAEDIKKDLSSQNSARKQLPNLFTYNGKTYDFTAELTKLILPFNSSLGVSVNYLGGSFYGQTEQERRWSAELIFSMDF